jgi:threonine/homoserine/homoserine lactone efflux protein
MDIALSEITIAWPNILLAWAALATVAASPGPTASAIMGLSMSQGRAQSFRFTAGAMTGSTCWALAAGLGLAAWLTSFAYAFFILKILGGLYLLWMAYKAARSALTRSDAMPSVKKSGKNLYWQGFALHVTNPKAVLGWTAVIALGQTGSASLAVLLTTLGGCLAITYTIHFTYAALFASKPSVAFYRRARRWIEGFLASVFALAGTRLLASAWR